MSDGVEFHDCDGATAMGPASACAQCRSVDAHWADKRDQWSEAIDRAHPTLSGLHAEYMTAMQMVGNRHSKGAICKLVNWLLVRAYDHERVVEAARKPLTVDHGTHVVRFCRVCGGAYGRCERTCALVALDAGAAK